MSIEKSVTTNAGSKDFSCALCNSRDATVLETYKHVWYSCNGCGTMRSVRKDRCFFDGLVPSWSRMLLPNRLYRMLTTERKVIEDGAEFYAYYKGILERHHTSDRTKWCREREGFLEHLHAVGYDISNKRLLDVSGGPGFLVHELKPRIAHGVVTEFSSAAVSAMGEVLGVNARKFDYNTDELSERVDGPFDIVKVNSLNFCDDPASFAGSLRKVLAPKGIVYLQFGPPSLGRALLWQADDYTLKNMYPAKVIARVFREQGFTLEKQITINDKKHYLKAHRRSYTLAILPFCLWYGYLKRADRRGLTGSPFLTTHIQFFS